MSAGGVSPRGWWWRGVVGFAVLLIVGVYVMVQLAVPVHSATGAPVHVTITEGAGVHEVAADLERAGLLRGTYWFRVWVWLTGREGKLVAGEYYLPPNANVIGLVQLMSGGVTPTCETSVRLVEGWTIRDMQQYLDEVHASAATGFTAAVTTRNGIAASTMGSDATLLASRPTGASLEGYLFPDTYRLYCNATASNLVQKMIANLAEKFPSAWRERVAKRGMSVHQALTLASIVEKEVPGDSDRAIVADIFMRRLAVWQALQADSTVNYVTGKADPAVSAEDVNINSPYNTYRHRGLPPGPIANPGVSAIRAVVNPTPNSYWYFLTTKQGQVIYSKTFEDHQKAKYRYLR